MLSCTKQHGFPPVTWEGSTTGLITLMALHWAPAPQLLGPSSHGMRTKGTGGHHQRMVLRIMLASTKGWQHMPQSPL